MKGNQRWMKLRTTVQLSSAISSQSRSGKSPLKRQDSFIKKFSTRNIAEARDSVNGEEEDCYGLRQSAQLDPFGKPITRKKKSDVGEMTVINPDCQFYFRWLFVVTSCTLYNLWTPIVRQAFPELQNDFRSIWLFCDVLSDVVFFTDILVQFRTGYLEQGLIVYDSQKLARHYVGSRSFWFDVVCMTPLDLLQFQIGFCPVLRFPRFLKVYRVYAYYYIVESRTWYPNLWRVVNLIHVLLLLAHWFGCFYYMLSEYEDFHGEWVYPNPRGAFGTLTRKYLASMYWSTLTLTTIGDLPTPETNRQYLFTIVSYMIGVFIFATIVGQVGNVITNRNANRLEFERLLDSAKLYMRHHKVPRDMQRRVQRWYDYSWSRGRLQGGGDINTALGILPDKLKTELALHVNLNTLKKVTIFQECQPEFLHDLVLKMKAYIFTPGDLICRKGEVAREMFIIADGILEVISETGKVLTTMKAGDFFGEIGILNLDGFNKRTADVRSVGYSELFSLSREDVLSAMKDYPDAREILQTLGKKRLMEAKKQATLYQAKGQNLHPNAEPAGVVKTQVHSKRLPQAVTAALLKTDKSDSDSQQTPFNRHNIVQRLRSDVREWKQQLMQRSPKTCRKDTSVLVSSAAAINGAKLRMFPAPGSGGGGDSGGETSSKMISAAPGINKVGDFKIGSSSDESDPLLVASSQQQRKLNGARKPANFRKNGSRHRQVAASVSSIESTSRDSAEVSCSSFIRPLTAEETPDTEHSLSAGKPRVGEESRTFQTCAPPPDLITGDTKRTAEAADKPDPAAIPWTLDETLQVVKDTVGGVSIEMQKMKPGERIGNASRPRPPASLSLMEKRLSLLHRAQTTDSNPSRRLKNDVKINVNTPTEDSCSPEELEHFIPSQDPAACRAELDILGTVYQVPQLLSPSRNPSQKLSASPRQLQRKSVGSFEPAAFAKARSNRPKSARERSTTESTASANTKSAQDLSTPAGEKHPIQRQIAQEISTSLDSLTTAVDKSEEPKEAPASEFRIKGFPGSCGVSKKPEENPSPAGDHVVEEPSIIETQEEISGAALTLRSILKSLSNSNAFIPNKTRTARKTRRSKTVDGTGRGADDDSSKKTVTFEGRSFSGALFGGDGDQSSDGSSSDEGQQSTGFNHWFACLESRGIEEKDKALLVCVLLGIKELFHDKMHKMSRRYSTKLLNLQSELREKEDTIRFLHKKLKTLQMSVAEVESLTSSTSDDDCGGILSCQRVTHTQNDHKALDENRKQSTNSPMLVKTALTQEELMELEFASALQRNLSRTDVAIRVEESTSPHHSDDEENPARNPHAKRSSNDWEVMMLAEQMSEREKKADNLRHAAERLLSMQHQQTGRTFSQEEEEEVVSALTEFSASELDLLEKMIWEEEKNESSRSGKLKRSRSEKYSKPKKKRSASLAPGETLTSPRDPASPEMPPFGSHGVHDIWAQPSASSGVTATSSKPELTLSPSSLVPPPGGSKKKCSTSLAVAEVNKTAVAGIPEAHTIDITKN